MKWTAVLITIFLSVSAHAQIWKVLPKGVRIVGIRNVVTNKISKNFNSSGQESSLGASFRIDGTTFNQLSSNALTGTIDPASLNSLVVGEYKVDADAQFNVRGTGFGWGLTDTVMFYAEIAYYNANVQANIKRTAGNSYERTSRELERLGGVQNNIIAENLRNMVDANEGTIQSVITNYYGYKPIGNWYGAGYGDLEAGFMTKLIDRGTTGLMFYPGVILPTGLRDDPDILQDVGFGDGQFDLFAEVATGYLFTDRLSVGTSLRYTYQAPTSKALRIPESRDFQLSKEKGTFDVKYGDRFNYLLNTTYTMNDWFSITPIYRFMYQLPSQYDSEYGAANDYLAYNSRKTEHQVQLTTTVSSIKPFLKKEFMLPAQINVNLVKTVSGQNVPSQGRFEVEFRMLF
jgi:hypothetical protein